MGWRRVAAPNDVHKKGLIKLRAGLAYGDGQAQFLGRAFDLQQAIGDPGHDVGNLHQGVIADYVDRLGARRFRQLRERVEDELKQRGGVLPSAGGKN